MRFTQGLWQHRNCNDLQLRVEKVQFIGPSYTKMRVFYIRKDFGCGEVLLFPTLYNVKITKDQYENWRRVG